MSDSNFARDFYTEFQATRNDFTTRLSTTTSSHASEFSAQLALLRKKFVDVRSFLPPYDQRQYEMQLKSWEQALEKLQTNQTSAGTKPKFAFKRKDKLDKPTPDASEVKAPTPAETISRLPTSHLSLTSKSGCLLTFTSLPDTSSIPIDSELIIANLDNCIVDLMEGDSATMTPTAVHIRNVTNCVLLLPVIKGSILLHDLQRCVVVISGCHQFRMHTSRCIDVYLSIAAKPVIEKCTGIYFSEYPASSPVGAEGLKNQFRVEDFSHIRQTPSPNWTLRNDKTATLEHWLKKFRDSGRDANEWDLQVLAEILAYIGGEGSG
ncbi:TBCC-domain-containing protein [Thelephora ganbajun]|uniref:TBCC-domain-containing protein n=1 Tax=Thelephora ganbajun TaxID=370292 RepID=A0ACB6ZCS4_THEGA|nr:TBCC-domain-containing protein [Thelephora ganbajun]